jgi:hypothetical protein
MKTGIYILGIIYLLYGCDVLNVEPTDSIPASAAFKDKAGIERGIIGSYSSLQSLSYYGRTYIIFADLAADNLNHPTDATSSDYAEVDNNAILPENSSVNGIWASIYDGINVVNNVIAKVPGINDMTETEKYEALAELYFLRALNHFNLLNFFGAIPLKITPTVGVSNLDAGRDPVNVVYSKVIEDLSFSEQYLVASASTKIRASKYAAKALLARVYLYQGNYSQAYEKANDVILNGGYTLLENYSDIFSEDGSAETIFEVDFTELDRNRLAEYNFPKTLNGRREVAPSESLLNAYEPGDDRIATSIAYSGTNAYANKYNDLKTGTDNVIVLRLAEMYLIRAEAEANKTGGNLTGISDDINLIRSRANLPATTANTINELLSAIEKERRAEFAFEGQRWFDLVRTGRAMDILPTVINLTKTLFPVPLGELQTNNSPEMIQNPGYN